MARDSARRHVRFFLHVATLGRYEEIANETIAAILAAPATSADDRIEIGVVGDGPLALASTDERIAIVRNGADVAAFEFPTLAMIHRFAARTPDAVVVYLNCLGGRYTGADYEIRRRWRAMLHQLFVTDRERCLGLLDTHDVCGVEWTRLPLPHMTSNNWMANAAYVATLPPPDDYRDAVAGIDLSRFGERWQTSAIKRRHAGEFWIGADPAARPCSLVPISHMGLPRSEFGSAPWWALPGIRWDRIARRVRHGGDGRERIRFAAQVVWFNALFLARAAKRRLRSLRPARAVTAHRV